MGEEKLKVPLYDINVLARSLKLASIDIINTSKIDIESHWYRSSGPVDLFFWKAQDRLVKHQINLFGQVVEWNEFDGLKTGYVNEEEIGNDAEYGETICFDKSPNAMVLAKASEFLNLATLIEEQVRKEMTKHYQSYGRWQNLKWLRAIFGPRRGK